MIDYIEIEEEVKVIYPDLTMDDYGRLFVFAEIKPTAESVVSSGLIFGNNYALTATTSTDYSIYYFMELINTCDGYFAFKGGWAQQWKGNEFTSVSAKGYLASNLTMSLGMNSDTVPLPVGSSIRVTGIKRKK